MGSLRKEDAAREQQHGSLQQEPDLIKNENLSVILDFEENIIEHLSLHVSGHLLLALNVF